MTKSIVTKTLALTFMALAAGCASSGPGVVRAPSDSPIVSVSAGDVGLRGGQDHAAYYVVDRETHSCWFLLDGTTPADCCVLRRALAVRPLVFWEDDATCWARGVMP